MRISTAMPGWGLGALVVVTLGCSSGDGGTSRAEDGDTAADGSAPDAAVVADAALPTDALAGDQGLADAKTVSPYKVARGIIHAHSIYSHDGCDSQGFIDGQPNIACLQQLRAAVCANRYDFLFLTDHPDSMSEHSLKEDLLHNAGGSGDQLVMADGVPIANRIACNGGHGVLLSVGFESRHMMPLGLEAMPGDEALYEGADDQRDPTELKQQVQALADLGAVVSMVHTEEADISAATIVAAGFETMEWYNIHANIETLIGSDTLSFDPDNIGQIVALIGKLGALEDFLNPGTDAPHPDLVYLVMLDQMPMAGFDKWREAQTTRLVTGVLGTDVHRNVSVDTATCAGALAVVCLGALALAEGTLGYSVPEGIKSLLLSGGTINLSDGDRIDSYARIMRWMENRVLVESIDQRSIKQALREGRAYGVWTVFGDPTGFAFTGRSGSATLQMGEAGSGPLTLEVDVPARPVFTGGAPFSETQAQSAEVHTRLLRIAGPTATVVHEQSGLGLRISKQVTEPGAYYVELSIKPKHLTTALGKSAALADRQYPWVITNPIFVQ